VWGVVGGEGGRWGGGGGRGVGGGGGGGEHEDIEGCGGADQDDVSVLDWKIL